MKKIITFLVLLYAIQLSAQSWGEKLGATAMSLWKDSISSDSQTPKWIYEQGFVLKGIEGLWYKTGDGKYFDYMQKSMDMLITDKGDIRTYKPDYYNLDNVLCGRILITLYNVTGKEKYFKAAVTLMEQFRKQPRTQEGGFWYKKLHPNQMWLDGLCMGEPFYAEYALAFHDNAAFDDIANQFIWMESHVRDTKTGLLYHRWDESKKKIWANKATGCSPDFWARAMGWYGMALVDVLDKFPPQNEKKKLLIQILKRYVTAIQKVQDVKTGSWYNILDNPTVKWNCVEASASCMFAYTIAKGIRLRYLPVSYLPVVKKGYNGIIKNFVETGANGQTNLKGTTSLCVEPGGNGSYDFNTNEKVVVNDPNGVGAFIQAANEMDLLETQNVGKGKTALLDDYFNSEKKKDISGKVMPYHYKWEEMDNNGFSILGYAFNRFGAQTKTISAAPTRENLKKGDIYIIVDADNIADKPIPNYVKPKDADAVYDWVKAGGVLAIFHNDKGNAEFEHFNQLTEKFGIHLNEDSYNKQTPGPGYEFGAVEIKQGDKILPHVKKIFQKEVCSITVKSPAHSALTKGSLTIFAVSKIGRGTVFLTGDPWLYNEYTDGRKIPLEYENYKAANDLVQWLIAQTKSK